MGTSSSSLKDPNSSSSKNSGSSTSKNSGSSSSKNSVSSSLEGSCSKKKSKYYCSEKNAGSVCRCEDKNWYQVIKKKLEAISENEYTTLLQELEIESQHDLIWLFGNENLFMEKFLTIKIEKHEKLLEEMESEFRQLRDFQQYPQEITADELRNEWKNTLEYREQSKNYNIYLYFEKLSINNIVLQTICRSIFPYGAFHVGLEIDGIVVEWGYGFAGPSIICPRTDARKMLAYVRLNYEKIDSEYNARYNFKELLPIGATIRAFSLATLATNLIRIIGIIAYSLIAIALYFSHKVIYHLGKINKNRLRLIAETCVHYNKTYSYSATGRNCQHFVDEMLESLGLKFKPEGEFLKFMKRIKNGDGSFQFKDTNFESRKDFDSYVDSHWDSIENEWDKKLLICYSDVMDSLYNRGEDLWGPKNLEAWLNRYEELK
ncbi:1823_t:CDS:1 [Cetraspora pellucida]|uniref:1823_t:CDS:1 n=1 Tax=Cetraspora pellucida TaxID=1433469 RepID=A0ACA9KTF2_9GLOM|nr:1823_t:CDS:1 [Cetraspora pellucida]